MSTIDPFVHNPPFPKNYASDFLVMEKGKGCYLWDKSGNKYLDFGSGIAVNALGYGRSDLAKIAKKQMKKLIHISNLFTTQPALDFAQALVASGPFAAVHFGNSGTEANEGAMKYARVYSLRTKGPGKHKFLSFRNAFHGRTFGALSLTPTPKYQAPYEPLVPDVYYCDYNDVEGLSKILDDSFAAVMLEPIQGEGGLNSVTLEFAQKLNELCQRFDILMIADEIQTGIGRTGEIFAYGALGLKPDIVTLSKPLAGGLPLSATLIPKKVNDIIHVGDHGTTFGGGPVTSAVGLHVWKIITDPVFLAGVREKGAFLRRCLEELKKQFPTLTGEIRGKGLLQGLQLNLPEGKDVSMVVNSCREEGLIILRSGTNLLRIAPPLVISKKEIAEGVGIIGKVLGTM